MPLKIIWSEFAETKLDEIHEYYEKKTSPRIAKKLLKGIINEPKKLIKAPQIAARRRIIKAQRNRISILGFQKLQTDIFGGQSKRIH